MCVTAFSAQEFGQLVREVEQRLARQDQLAAAAHGPVDVHDRDVEVERGLVRDDRPARPAEGALRPAREEQHAAVRDGDALGRARGAGGVHYIDGVGVRHRAQRGVYERGILLRGGQLVDEQDAVIPRYVLEVPGEGGVCNDGAGREVRYYLLEPPPRRGGVRGYIGPPGVHRGAEAAYHRGALREIHHHRRVGEPQAQQRARGAAGHFPEPGVAQRAGGVRDGFILGPEPISPLEQADGGIHSPTSPKVILSAQGSAS